MTLTLQIRERSTEIFDYNENMSFIKVDKPIDDAILDFTFANKEFKLDSEIL